ncbi:HIG1 domain family member 2A, mitochondrial [Cataglyphis hispanica]|uniref:HIG1 domain family member 2A, mitochondrial n=1 Tax=Cataglyphis hispanica TaxID=1086592 RepID=UPI00217F9C82|nr:HIG1 domain family member 2A, mitochondrial [Cataglyphis hispanica]
MADQKSDIELDWVKVREDLHREFLGETIFEKAKRKTRENPLVPIGCLATTAALTAGLISFVKEKSQMQQYMMRARVGAQTFTIVCIVAGFILLPKSS